MSNPTIILSMLRNGPFRCSRIGSLARLAQLTPIFPSNHGTNLPLKSRTPSIYSVHLAPIPTIPPTKPSKAPTTGTDTRWPHPVQKQLSTTMPTHAHHGRHEAWMRGYLVPPKTTTAATYTTYLKPLDITYPAPQHCIAPPFSNETHVNELSEEIQDTLTKLT